MNRFAGRFYLDDEMGRQLRLMQGYGELEMYDDAIRECRNLIRMDPDFPQLFLDLGNYYEEAGKIEKAIRCYKRAIRRFPDDSRFYTNLGYCLGKYKKRSDMEREWCEKALAIDPANEWALNNIGAVLTREGKWEEGLAYYQRAYDACQKSYNYTCHHIVHNVAHALYRCGKYTRAWLIYSYLAEACPEGHHVLSDFGRVNYRMGCYDRALELFEQALALSPQNRCYGKLCRMMRRKLQRQR